MDDFDPDEYLLETGEGNAEFQVKKPDHKSRVIPQSEQKNAEVMPGKRPGYTESLLRGAAQGYTSGFSDEAIGGLSSLAGADYKTARDEARKANEAAYQENPITYGTGVLAGGIGQAFTPGLNAAGLASKAPFLTTVGQGVLAGVGFSDEEKAKDIAGDAALGGLVSAPFGVAAKAMRGAPQAAKSLESTAQERAFKATSGQFLKDLKTEAAAGRVVSTDDGLNLARGKDLLQADESGPAAVGWMSKAEDIAPRVQAKSEFFGGKIGEVANKIDELKPEGAVTDTDILTSAVEQMQKLPKNVETDALQDKLMTHLKGIFENRNALTFSEAQKQKNYYQWSPSKNLSMPADKDLHTMMKGIIGRAMDKAADRVARESPDQAALINNYQRYKQKYGSFEGANRAAFDRQLKNLSNRFLSPTDYAVGLGTGVGMLANQGPSQFLPSLAVGALGAGANKLVRERGSAFTARGAQAIADMIQSTPQKLGRFAPIIQSAIERGSLPVVHSLLLKSSPEYQSIVNDIVQPTEEEAP